jgi:hypothetical protein
MRRPAIGPTLSTRLRRVGLALGTAVVLAALVATPASARAERQAGRYSLVVGLGDEPAFAGQPNSLQVLIRRDGKPATDLAGRLGGLQASAFYGTRADPELDRIALPLEPFFGEGWGTPGDYRSFFVPTRPGSYTVHLHGRLGAEKIDLVIPSGPDTFGDVRDPARTAFPAVGEPTAGQLAQRLDREAIRMTATLLAATEARRQAEQAAARARLLTLAGLLLGLVGLAAATIALTRTRRPPAPTTRPDVALTGAGKY